MTLNSHPEPSTALRAPLEADKSPRPSYPEVLRNHFPTAHLIRAALQTASLIDGYGSPVPATRSAYLLYPSDALYPPEDLRIGESILLASGLLLNRDDLLYPTASLQQLLVLDYDEAAALLLERLVAAALPENLIDANGKPPTEVSTVAEQLIRDPQRREALLIALGRRYDVAWRAEIGAKGEEFVLGLAREELMMLGQNSLAERVRRVSQVADDLGYDIDAPRIGGTRRLEVKSSSRSFGGRFHFFISRSEFDWGINDGDWALVACRIHRNEDIELVGGCRAAAFEQYLPIDAEGGCWMTAEIEVPETLFVPGLPPAV